MYRAGRAAVPRRAYDRDAGDAARIVLRACASAARLQATEEGDEPAEQAYAAALNAFRAREHGQAVLDFLDFIAKYPDHALAPSAQYWIGEAYYPRSDAAGKARAFLGGRASPRQP